jgi:hypothetical protein
VNFDATVHQILMDFMKDYDSVSREVLYTIPIEFEVSMKIVTHIRCLNETVLKSL